MASSRKPIELKVALGNLPHVAALKNGDLGIDGVQFNFVDVHPMIAAFRRMVRYVEFDLCEIAPTTYVIARAFGAPFIALPIFLTRRFHHGGLLCREDAGIETPKDLEGKKVGVRAYSVTTGVWTRGIMINEYGLDSSRVTWVVDDEEHVPQLRLPQNVIHVPPGHSLASMMAQGEIQAGFAANAGIGREGPPEAGWETKQKSTPLPYRDLFADPASLEAEWFGRTGIYPMHGVVVVKEQLLSDNPWLAGELFNAFTESKNRYVDRLRDDTIKTAQDQKYRDLMKVVGADPLPYGFAANLVSIEALVKYAFQQQLIPRKVRADELFLDLN